MRMKRVERAVAVVVVVGAAESMEESCVGDDGVGSAVAWAGWVEEVWRREPGFRPSLWVRRLLVVVVVVVAAPDDVSGSGVVEQAASLARFPARSPAA